MAFARLAEWAGDDAAAAKLRRGEFVDLTVDAVVQIGSARCPAH